MTPRRVAAVGWAIVLGGGGSVAITVAGRRARFLGQAAVAAQALVPWSALAAWPVVVATTLGSPRRTPLGTTGTIVGAAGLVIAARTAGRPRIAASSTADRVVRGRLARSGTPARNELAAAASSTEALSIANVNLLYLNAKMARGVPVLRKLDADVLTFCEYTPAHADDLVAGLAERYPHRIDRPGPVAHGTALWSRFPLTEVYARPLQHERITADVTTPHGFTVRVLVVHTVSPPTKVGPWRAELALLAAESPPADRPAVMIGDFNASWNHPELRAIVASGWRSAHRDWGRGLSPSWPADRWYPPFVRIDHALVNDQVSVVAIEDFGLPGSDHRGLVVTVAPARRAAP
ncbi:MAG: endonuclease/exonuclease/phosphatase family protein [Actinomycetota bacterium]|nr:endonuclease/exonuclease/phosphatase family protein [Actinomycetota bacterium]